MLPESCLGVGLEWTYFNMPSELDAAYNDSE